MAAVARARRSPVPRDRRSGTVAGLRFLDAGRLPDVLFEMANRSVELVAAVALCGNLYKLNIVGNYSIIEKRMTWTIWQSRQER